MSNVIQRYLTNIYIDLSTVNVLKWLFIEVCIKNSYVNLPDLNSVCSLHMVNNDKIVSRTDGY